MNRGRIRSIEEIAPNVFDLEVTLVEPARLEYEPGQAVSVRIPGTDEYRSYSIAGLHGGDTLQLLVRRIGGVGSQFLASLVIGAPIEFNGPQGEFRLAPGPGDAVFGATGVGASALFPMMEALARRPNTGRIVFCWGLMQREDSFWDARLAALAEAAPGRFDARLVFTGAGDGFVTEPIIETARTLTTPTYYLCGNGQMVRDVIDGLTRLGIDRDRQIRTDWY